MISETVEDPQRSKRLLLYAQAEERRKLRHNLHDGLAPILASQMLKLEQVLDLIGEDRPEGQTILRALIDETGKALADLRRLVSGLRPAGLDELGLVGAIREHAKGLEYGPLRIQVEGAAPQADPPAAIEEALYATVKEALSGIVGRADVQHCIVRFDFTNGYRVEVIAESASLGANDTKGQGWTETTHSVVDLGGGRQLDTLDSGKTRLLVWFPGVEE